MNQCKSCGSLFQSTLTTCPVCHTSLIATANKKTDDFTQRYNPLAGNVELVRLKSRLVTTLLAFILGSVSAHLFYLRFLRRGVLLLALNVLALLLAVLVPEIFSYIWMAIFASSHLVSGFYYLFNMDAKDAKGDFLQ
jgi:TM2 domain-containing membrane protein YozV